MERPTPGAADRQQTTTYSEVVKAFYSDEMSLEEFGNSVNPSAPEHVPVDWEEHARLIASRAEDAEQYAKNAKDIAQSSTGPRVSKSQLGGAYEGHRYSAELVREGKHVSAARGAWQGHPHWQDRYYDGDLD